MNTIEHDQAPVQMTSTIARELDSLKEIIRAISKELPPSRLREIVRDVDCDDEKRQLANEVLQLRTALFLAEAVGVDHG